MIINKCWRSAEYPNTFCYGLFLSSRMDVCTGSYTKSPRRMKENKDIASWGHLAQERIWKDVSGAPTEFLIPSTPPNTFCSVCFLPGTHSSTGSIALHWREKMKKKVLGWETVQFCSYGSPRKIQKYNPPERDSV